MITNDFVANLTIQQLDNFGKLANYMEAGNLRAEFNMSCWREKTICGTVACFAGQGTDAGIPKLKGEAWPDYVNRQFGVGFCSDAFDWLFSSLWAKIDNTTDGALKRLRYALDKRIPVDFLDQMKGQAPLCYRHATEERSSS